MSKLRKIIQDNLPTFSTNFKIETTFSPIFQRIRLEWIPERSICHFHKKWTKQDFLWKQSLFRLVGFGRGGARIDPLKGPNTANWQRWHPQWDTNEARPRPLPLLGCHLRSMGSKFSSRQQTPGPRINKSPPERWPFSFYANLHLMLHFICIATLAKNSTGAGHV